MNMLKNALNLLKDLENTMKEINSELENMRPNFDKKSFIVTRDSLQNRIEKSITPLWKTLSIKLGIQSPDETPGEVGVAANVIAKNILDRGQDLLFQEKQLLYQMSLDIPEETSDTTSHPMSGLLDYFRTGVQPVIQHTDAEDIAMATKALGFYFDAASQYPDFKFSNLNDLIAELTRQNSYFMIGFGGAINDIIDTKVGYDESSLQDTMQKLADAGQGNLPASWNTFFSVVGQDASNPSIWTSIKFTTGATIADVAAGVESVGQNLVTGLSGVSNMLKYLPFILIIGGGFYLYVKAGGGKKFLSGASK